MSKFGDEIKRFRFVSDNTKFCYFSATLAKLLTWEPPKKSEYHKQWTSDVIVTCFGMKLLGDRLEYFNKENDEEPLNYYIWMQEAKSFVQFYNVTGITWTEMDKEMDTLGFKPMLDPDYVYDGRLIEPETPEDRKIFKRNKQILLYYRRQNWGRL
jgi:hypothetical protein